MDIYTGKGELITIDNAQTNAVTMTPPWDTVIHRGWISGARENSIPAFYLVKENGYSWAECDVRFSSDGIPVLSHDDNIGVITSDSSSFLTISQSTVQQIQSLVMQTHDRFGEIRIATLSELLDMARLIGLGIVIDIKAGTTDNMTTLAKTVLSSGWSDHVVYMPTSIAAAQAIAAVDRNASFDFVSSVTSASDLPDLTPYQALLTGANTVGFDLQASVTDADGGMDPALYDALRAAGLSVSFWNIRWSAHKTYMDAGPLRITKQNTADASDLNASYLQDKSFF